MALIDNLRKEKQALMFVLIGLNNQTVYIKTDKYQSSKEMVNDLANYGVLLRRINSGEVNVEVAYAPGFFISAQIIGEQSVSTNHNKIWEIAE
jgi:hypothetical protein